MLDLNFETAQQTAALIAKMGGNAIPVKVDVSREAEIEKAVLEIDHRFEGLDTIIANAGVMLFDRDTIATELDLGAWRQCLNVNLTGIFLTCKHGLRALLRSGGGANWFARVRSHLHRLQHQQVGMLWVNANIGH